MKKTVKAIGVTAALAVMIPLSAYAATNTSGSTTTAATTNSVQTAAPAKEIHFGKGALDQTVLDLLKLDQATVKTKLSAGKTLAEIATEQGVSREALKQALTDAHNTRLEAQKQTFATNLDTMIDTKGKASPDKGIGEFRGFAARDLTAASTILGLTNTELKTALESGKSLANLATEKNVDVQMLIDAQKTAITTAIKQAVTDGKLTQAQADTQLANVATFAENIVNDTHVHKGGHGGKGHH
jgi:hypothetical protein